MYFISIYVEDVPRNFERNPKHAETFAILFTKMFVVIFMCPTDCLEITVIGISEYSKTPMYENVVHKKVRNAI